MLHNQKILSLLIAGTLTASHAHAKEAGDQYPNGAEGFMAGALPPPGHYLINYPGFFNGDLHDSNGDKVEGVEVNAAFEALRYVRVSEQTLFGASWAYHIIVPVVSQEISTPVAEEQASGLGDITINPMILGWHLSPNLHIATGLDINLPTGRYDKDEPLKNIGANYYSIEPILAATYLTDNGYEASAKLMYNIKGKNEDTDYQSGDEFHMDYTLAKHNGPWAYGIGGYYLQQTTDDEQNGVKVGDGNRGMAFAVGPQLQYNAGRMNFMLKWHHETAVENRFGGDKVFFKFAAAF